MSSPPKQSNDPSNPNLAVAADGTKAQPSSYVEALMGVVKNPYLKPRKHIFVNKQSTTTPTPTDSDISSIAKDQCAGREHPTPPDETVKATVADPVSKSTKKVTIAEPTVRNPEVVAQDTNVPRVVTDEKKVQTRKSILKKVVVGKPAPSKEYNVLYNAGPKSKKKKKIVPRKLPLQPKGPQPPTVPPMPGLEGTVERLAKHFDSNLSSNSDDDAVHFTIDLNKKQDHRSSKVTTKASYDDTTKASSKVTTKTSSDDTTKSSSKGTTKASSDDTTKSSSKITTKASSDDMTNSPPPKTVTNTGGDYITRNSFVRATVRNFAEIDGTIVPFKVCEGMVIKAVNKGLWKVAFYNDLKGFRIMRSNQLTLV